MHKRYSGYSFYRSALIATFVVASLAAGCSSKKNSANAVGQSIPENPTKPNPDDNKPNQNQEPEGPIVLVKSDYKEGEITAICDKAIADTTAIIDQIAKTAPEKRTVETTLLALEKASADFSDLAYPLTFMGYVSTDEKIREEGSSCEEKMGAFYVSLMTRKDLFDALKSSSVTPRNAAEERLMSETLKGFVANGLELSEEKLKQMRELKTKLTSLESEFSSNLNEDKSFIKVTKEELDGLSEDFIARLKPSPDGDGKLLATTKSTDYVQIMEKAKNTEVRKRMLMAYTNRAADKNVALLEQAIGLRQQIAALMGYSTWADYRTQGRMAKDGKTVLDFLNGLKEKLSARNKADIGKLLKFKQESDPTATAVNAWDINYLSYQLKKRDYSLDDEKVREYFPSDVVMAGMFKVYSDLLGVNYVEEKDAKVWSPDVKLYRIVNKSDSRLVGFFYADFIPREGKYGHAAAFPLISGRRLDNGAYSKPVASMVANFTPPGNGKPSLLSFDEVETLFHEFGHIMHQTLTRAPYASLSGSAVSQDFVEAPSQMLEHWVLVPEVLNVISGHYADNSKKLPKELLDQMLAAKDFNQGYFYSRQLMLGLTDMTYHTTSGSVDTTAVYNQLYQDILGVTPLEGGHFQASFGHLMGGYDAGYYGYLWSQVYSEDMYTVFEKAGVLSPEAGAKYRSVILEQGGIKDAMTLLNEFLGRAPNNDAFYKMLGI